MSFATYADDVAVNDVSSLGSKELALRALSNIGKLPPGLTAFTHSRGRTTFRIYGGWLGLFALAARLFFWIMVITLWVEAVMLILAAEMAAAAVAVLAWGGMAAGGSLSSHWRTAQYVRLTKAEPAGTPTTVPLGRRIIDGLRGPWRITARAWRLSRAPLAGVVLWLTAIIVVQDTLDAGQHLSAAGSVVTLLLVLAPFAAIGIAVRRHFQRRKKARIH